MLKMPLVTFIVTSYNYGQFINRTLESIKAQTYKNIEIIVVDDKSTDGSINVIERFIELNQDIRILLVKHDENKGQFAAFQTGIKEAHGQFISFVDSDDLLMPEFAEAHLRVHMAVSVAMTSSQIIEIDEDEIIHTVHSISSPQKSLNEAKKLDEVINIDIENIDYKILNAKFGGWHWSPTSSAMFRKSSVELILNYRNPQKWRICPDKFLFNFAHLIGGSAIIYEPLSAFRRHSTNAGDGVLIRGDKKLHSDKATICAIKNNLNIRPETIQFLLQNHSVLGKRNTARLIWTVLLSYL